MSEDLLPQFRSHSRSYDQNKFVYPVVSRRSRGISIGVNLNPDKVCNFDCVYCQVDRRSKSSQRFVEMERLLREVEDMFLLVKSGLIYSDPGFQNIPEKYRRLNDIAFSGDGEPTTFVNFHEIIANVAEIKQRIVPDVKMVLITNASMFHREKVRRGMEILDQNQGEIWGKLDAGTEEYFHLIDRTKIKFQQVLDNLKNAAIARPIVIQSLFMNYEGVPPTTEEITAYIGRLNDITAAGGKLKLVQVYTIARQPAESFVSPLSPEQVQSITDRVINETGLNAEAFC